MPPQQSAMIVRRSHSRSPHLREPVREIHSLRTGRFHGAPAGPRTCHARSRLTTKLSPGSFAKSPLQANRLHESHFTNPPPRKTARPNHQQARPVHQQPDQTTSKPDQSISNPTNHQQARPVHQQPDQTISSQTSPSARPSGKKLSTGQRPSASQRTASRPENRQPA